MDDGPTGELARDRMEQTYHEETSLSQECTTEGEHSRGKGVRRRGRMSDGDGKEVRVWRLQRERFEVRVDEETRRKGGETELAVARMN